MGEELVIYIAGPMTGIVDYNYPAFAKAAQQFRDAGYVVKAPNENFGGDQSRPYHDYLWAALNMVLHSNAIALLPGWENSKGARLELHVAQVLGHKVFDAVTMKPLVTDEIVTSLKAKANAETESILVEAERIVNGARQSAYGHPLDDFTKTAAMWSGIFGIPVTAEQVALAMIQVKISRLLNTPSHRDSMVDIAGYAKTYQMCRDERARRA